jgi:glycine C-acetyltransferase
MSQATMSIGVRSSTISRFFPSGDAAKSQKFAARMLEKGVYVIGFFYPVVPHGTARVRTQVSAAHSREDLQIAVNAFAEVNQELK